MSTKLLFRAYSDERVMYEGFIETDTFVGLDDALADADWEPNYDRGEVYEQGVYGISSDLALDELDKALFAVPYWGAWPPPRQDFRKWRLLLAGYAIAPLAMVRGVIWVDVPARFVGDPAIMADYIVSLLDRGIEWQPMISPKAHILPIYMEREGEVVAEFDVFERIGVSDVLDDAYVAWLQLPASLRLPLETENGAYNETWAMPPHRFVERDRPLLPLHAQMLRDGRAKLALMTAAAPVALVGEKAGRGVPDLRWKGDDNPGCVCVRLNEEEAQTVAQTPDLSKEEARYLAVVAEGEIKGLIELVW